MSTATYALHPFDRLLTETEIPSDLWLHDLPKDSEELHIQALVASGDYFEMLASGLEQISVNLPVGSVEQDQLDHYIGQLLYLYLHYKITKK
jgi:hypothetical protein